MVNVNKPISKDDGNVQKVENRRPRNTELNSSVKTVNGINHTTEQNPFRTRLNSSKKLNCSVTGNIESDVYSKLYDRTDDPQKIADALGMTVQDVLEVDGETEEYGYGKTVGYLVAKPEYEEELAQNGIDILSILEDGTVGMMVGRAFHTVETDLNLVLNRIDNEEDIDSSCGDKADADSSLNCEADTAKVSGTVTIYNDFADLDNDTTERLLRSRVEKAVPGAKVDFEKVNDTDIKVTIDCADADAEKARLAVESSDVAKSVDWNSATEELDSSADTASEADSSSTTENSAESTNLNSSEEPEGDTDGGDTLGEGSDEVAMITTESGNEVALSDIKIVQNPNTNELALFVKETEDDEIPEGFVVIADATQAALPADNICPECGQDPCVCENGEGTDGEGDEEFDSSKKKNELDCSENIKEVLADAGDDEHDVLTYVVQCIEHLGKADEVLSAINDEAAPEGSNLQEQLSTIDTHEALVAVVEALEDLGIVDEVLNTMAINPMGYAPDIDSNLNSSISEVKEDLNCDSPEGDCFAELWSAYIDDSYKCACCGKSFPAGHNSVQLDGYKPDGMHFIYKYTRDNRVGNSVNYDPYNLPPEDSEGGIFKVIVGEESDDEGYRWLNFCRNCWPKLTSKSPEEIYAEYSASEKTNEPTEGSVDSSLGADDFDDTDSSLNCSISEVKVPENFGRNTSAMLDLRNIIEGELADKGYEVSIKEIARPDAATMQISFEGETGNEAAVDKAIEEIVADVAGFNGPTDMNSSASDDEIIAEATQSYQVFYEDENGNELAEPAIINVPAGLDGEQLYEAITDEFAEEFPNCVWTTICDMNDNVKMDSSKKSELNSSVHDNPALKVFVDKIRQMAQQVSAVPTTEDGKTGYKIIVRGMESADVEPIAKEMGIALSGIKPLEGGFAIIVDDTSLDSSNVDPESPEISDNSMKYRDYLITGSDASGYICVSPYGKFSPEVYKTVDEAKEAIDKDMKSRFPEGDLDSTIDTDKLHDVKAEG